MNACINGNEPVLLSLSFMIRAITGLCDIITYRHRKEKNEREREWVFYAMQALSVISKFTTLNSNVYAVNVFLRTRMRKCQTIGIL
jgi:hypothetical protein